MNDVEYRYTPRGKVAHIVTNNLYTAANWQSLCGIIASDYYWRGTGSQDEYERVASLPLCRTCARLSS